MELSEFLVKAKNKTYASGGESREAVLGDGSKEFAYAEAVFQHRDRYLGFNPFIGEEVVWRNRELIWGMNAGRIDRFTGAERILDSGREIYKLFYHGARVKTD